MKEKMFTLLLALAILSICFAVITGQNSTVYPVEIKYLSKMENSEKTSQHLSVIKKPDKIVQEEVDMLETEGVSAEAIAVSFPLELNLATQEELQEIPGVGQVTAQRIVQYRDFLGGYTALEQLLEIQGIGEKTFEKLAPYLYLIGDEWDRQNQTQIGGIEYDSNG